MSPFLAGILAVQLGLLDDAARLFKEAGRFDYLNRLYQSAGIWKKAIKVGGYHVLLYPVMSYLFAVLWCWSTSDLPRRNALSRADVLERAFLFLSSALLFKSHAHPHPCDTALHIRWPKAAIAFT
jgi:hypothetical protein